MPLGERINNYSGEVNSNKFLDIGSKDKSLC